MKTRLISLLLSAAVMAVSCNVVWKQDDSSVTVKVQNPVEGGPSLVRLEVMGEKLIRVSATPERRFADPQSLVVLPVSEQAPFDVEQRGDTLTVTTAGVSANVLASTGEVWFAGKDGKVILREEEGGGKSFEPIEVDGTKGYSFRQVFESPEDEAFYGLGQHQADEFNYKGKNEELFQYNTKVSVPFIVSNKGYGVLMDSYSMMRFGNPSEYRQLGEVFTLYDKDGKEGCLTGTYVPAEGETLVREEPKIYFEYLVAPQMARVDGLPEGFRFYGSEVTYEGDIADRGLSVHTLLCWLHECQRRRRYCRSGALEDSLESECIQVHGTSRGRGEDSSQGGMEAGR